MQTLGSKIIRILIGFFLAAIAGYIVASVFATTANLMRLTDIGVEIPFLDAWRTYVFDLLGMAPTPFAITRYGTVIFIGLAIAFPVAALMRFFASRAQPALQRIVPLLFPAAGATAIGVSLVLMYQQYEVSAVAGGRGLGFLAQCIAGAFAGYVFQRLLQALKIERG